MENLILSQIPITDLKNIISEAVKTELQNLSNSQPPKEETEFLTRHETAKILNVSLPTLNEWTKQGIIIGYRIASRVRYKKNEITDAVKQISTLKYRRGA